MKVLRILICILTAALLLCGVGCALREPEPPDSQDTKPPVFTDSATGETLTRTEPPTDTQPPVTATQLATVPSTELPEGAASGEISSDTGTNMNILVKWYADAPAGGLVSVRLDVYLVCYSITKGAGSCWVTLGDAAAVIPTAALSLSDHIVDGRVKKNTVLLGSTVLTAAAGADAPLNLDWPFRGWYNNVWIDSVTAAGTLPLAGLS